MAQVLSFCDTATYDVKYRNDVVSSGGLGINKLVACEAGCVDQVMFVKTNLPSKYRGCIEKGELIQISLKYNIQFQIAGLNCVQATGSLLLQEIYQDGSRGKIENLPLFFEKGFFDNAAAVLDLDLYAVVSETIDMSNVNVSFSGTVAVTLPP